MSGVIQVSQCTPTPIDRLTEAQSIVEDGWTVTVVADIGDRVGSRALEIYDVDNDSLNEVLVGLSSFEGDQLRYYKHEGGVWTEHIIANTLSISSISIGDIDNDGQDEILVAGAEYDLVGAEVRYFEFEGGEWVSHDLANTDLPGLSTAIGDLDNDGMNEAAVGFFVTGGYGEVRYYEKVGESWSGTTVDDEGLGESDGVEIADIDHDGANELVYMGLSLSSGPEPTYEALHYYEYDGEGWNKTTIRCGTGWEMDTGDVDNDGETEIAWGNYFEPDNEVRVYDFVGDAWTEVNVSDMKGCPERVGVYHVAIGDANNDGENELAVGAGSLFLQVRFYKHNAGEWQEHNVSSVYPSVVQVVKIGDVDNDGKNEILVGLNGGYEEETSDEIRYFEEAESTTTSSDTTTTGTATTRTSTQTGGIDPLLLAAGVATPIGVVLVLAHWRTRRRP